MCIGPLRFLFACVIVESGEGWRLYLGFIMVGSCAGALVWVVECLALLFVGDFHKLRSRDALDQSW